MSGAELPREPVFAVPVAKLLARVSSFGEYTSWRCGLLLTASDRDARDICQYDHNVHGDAAVAVAEAIQHLIEVHGIHPTTASLAHWKAGFDEGWSQAAGVLAREHEAETEYDDPYADAQPEPAAEPDRPPVSVAKAPPPPPADDALCAICGLPNVPDHRTTGPWRIPHAFQPVVPTEAEPERVSDVEAAQRAQAESDTVLTTLLPGEQVISAAETRGETPDA